MVEFLGVPGTRLQVLPPKRAPDRISPLVVRMQSEPHDVLVDISVTFWGAATGTLGTLGTIGSGATIGFRPRTKKDLTPVTRKNRLPRELSRESRVLSAKVAIFSTKVGPAPPRRLEARHTPLLVRVEVRPASRPCS